MTYTTTWTKDVNVDENVHVSRGRARKTWTENVDVKRGRVTCTWTKNVNVDDSIPRLHLRRHLEVKSLWEQIKKDELPHPVARSEPEDVTDQGRRVA